LRNHTLCTEDERAGKVHDDQQDGRGPTSVMSKKNRKKSIEYDKHERERERAMNRWCNKIERLRSGPWPLRDKMTRK
jgi:hypothetical protein